MKKRRDIKRGINLKRGRERKKEEKGGREKVLNI